MKFKSIIVFLILGIYCFLSACQSFNWAVRETIILTGEKTDFEYFLTVNINAQEDTGPNTEVVKAFLDELEKYDLNAYTIRHKSFGIEEYECLYYAKDEKLAKTIWLANGKNPIFSEKEYYSSISEDPNKRIFTILADYKMAISPINPDNIGFELADEYHITSNDETLDLAKACLEITQSLNESFGDGTCKLSVIDNEGAYQTKFPNLNWQVFLPIVLVFVVIINASLLEKSGEIAKKKLEGYSSVRLFYDYYFQYILFNTLGMLAIFFAIVFFVLPIPLAGLKAFIYPFLENIGIFVGMLVISGLLMFGELASIPINLSVKGKNFTVPVLFVLRGFKIAIIAIGLSLFWLSSKAEVTFVKNYQNLPINEKKYENLYVMGGTKAAYDSAYINMSTSDNMRKAYYQLQREVGAVEYSADTITAADDSQTIYYHNVNDAFLLREGLVTDIPQAVTVFLYKNHDLNPLAVDIFKANYGTYNIVYYEKDILNYQMGYVDYFTVPAYTYNEILVFVPNDQQYSPYTVDCLQFYFSGTVEEAENYVNQVMIQNGLPPALGVISGEMLYELYQVIHINGAWKNAVMIVLWVLAFYLLNKQIIDLDHLQNGKRYFLSYLEGNKQAHFTSQLLLPNLVIWLAVQPLLFFTQRRIYEELLLLSLIIFSVEILASYFYHRKSLTDGKVGRN